MTPESVSLGLRVPGPPGSVLEEVQTEPTLTFSARVTAHCRKHVDFGADILVPHIGCMILDTWHVFPDQSYENYRRYICG